MNKITPRLRTYIFAGIATLALVLLAASLSSLQMSAGHPFSFAQIAPQVVDKTISSDWQRYLLAAIRVLLILLWVLLPIYIILLIVSKEARKRLLRDLALVMPILLLLYYLSNNQLTKRAGEDINPRLLGTPNQADLQGTPVPGAQFVPPPPWVTTAFTVAISATLVLIMVGVFLFIYRRAQARRYGKEPMKKVEREAQAALDALSAGGDLRETILRCYVQMVEAIREYRGINRYQDMTPHEFEVFLEKRGMPGEPVHQLTQLFEQVRYGTHTPGRKDEQIAISSLSAIVSACQRAAVKREAV